MYPVWEGFVIHSAFIVALIAVAHVLFSHVTVAATWFNWWVERKALLEGKPYLTDYLKASALRLLMFAYTLGAMFGVGIWFSVTASNPRGISTLIHNFVFYWASEWFWFIIDVFGIAVYYYTFGRVSPKTHARIGLILALAASGTLAIIVGILGFKLTPGAWLQTGVSLDGFYNPSFWPMLFARFGSCSPSPPCTPSWWRVASPRTTPPGRRWCPWRDGWAWWAWWRGWPWSSSGTCRACTTTPRPSSACPRPSSPSSSSRWRWGSWPPSWSWSWPWSGPTWPPVPRWPTPPWPWPSWASSAPSGRGRSSASPTSFTATWLQPDPLRRPPRQGDQGGGAPPQPGRGAQAPALRRGPRRPGRGDGGGGVNPVEAGRALVVLECSSCHTVSQKTAFLGGMRPLAVMLARRGMTSKEQIRAYLEAIGGFPYMHPVVGTPEERDYMAAYLEQFVRQYYGQAEGGKR